MVANHDDPKPSGSAQYNDIVDAYSELYQPDGELRNDFPLAEIEVYQYHTALIDPMVDIRGKHVLDLACGNGHNTHRYLAWAAESVTGMEISSAMLELARQDARNRDLPESRVRYVLGDATDPDLTVQGAPFDIVTSSWLLNYASDTEMMTRMWMFIGRHLKPSCHALNLTVPLLLTDQPCEEHALAHAIGSTGAWGRHGNVGKVLKAMPSGDGYKIRIELNMAAKENEAQHKVPSFEDYHLCLRVFEESCKASGMFGDLEWRDFIIPEEVKMRYTKGYWNDLALAPHCRICVARRFM